MNIYKDVSSNIYPIKYATKEKIYVPINIKTENRIYENVKETIYVYDEEEYTVAEYIKKIEKESNMLKECIFEISEILYK